MAIKLNNVIQLYCNTHNTQNIEICGKQILCTKHLQEVWNRSKQNIYFDSLCLNTPALRNKLQAEEN